MKIKLHWHSNVPDGSQVYGIQFVSQTHSALLGIVIIPQKVTAQKTEETKCS